MIDSKPKEQQQLQLEQQQYKYELSEEEKRLSQSKLSQPYSQTLMISHPDKAAEIMSNASSISGSNNCSPKVVSMFNLTPFTSLKQLWMNHNHIESIQSLISMYMPTIKKLSFSHNRLTTVKSLRRLYLPALDQVQLDHNYIHDTMPLAEMRVKERSSVSLWLYFSESGIQKARNKKCINAKVWPLYYKN